MTSSVLDKTKEPTKPEESQKVKFQRIVARLAVMTNYLMFGAFSFFTTYVILKLKIRWILILLSMMILQKLYLKRNRTFNKWIQKIFHP